jgi:hypothetical protein
MVICCTDWAAARALYTTTRHNEKCSKQEVTALTVYSQPRGPGVQHQESEHTRTSL